MVQYIPPNSNSIFFTFSSEGYQAPTFDNIDFNFSSILTSDLQATINIAQLYYNETYTYTKFCRKIIIGYSDTGVQTIDLPCLFGGIRDLESIIACKTLYTRTYTDLVSFLRVNYRSTSDIASYIRALYKDDTSLLSYNRAIYKSDKDFVAASRAQRSGSSSFSSFTRQAFGGSLDFFGYMRFLRGKNVQKDLSAALIDIQPKNILAFLNIIETRDLQTSIEGGYLKGFSDFYIAFNKLLHRESSTINGFLYGWDTKDLLGKIISLWKKDLNAEIFAGFFAVHKNLSSLINCVTPRYFSAHLHGYAASDLNIFTILGFLPNDLPAHIAVVREVYLAANIYGRLGLSIPYTLNAFIKGVATSNLLVYIDVNAAKNLIANIVATGKYLDLTAKIAPRTINIKRMLFIPLLSSSDLKATIQYNCQSSSFSDFSSYVYPIRNKDLKGYIIGWFSGTADNIKDLAVHINYTDYCVQNFIEISGMGHARRHAKLPLTLDKKQEYRIQNYYNLFGGSSHSILNAFIIGHLHHADLKTSLTAKPIANFTAIPSWMNPATLEAVINLTRFEERWTRFVEMMFFTNSTEDFHYFYVSGENKIYKVDKNRTWRIRVTGYSEDNSSIYRRVKVNKKFAFNLKNYKSVDEAVRDLIDRVTLFKSKNLAAFINAYDLEHRNLLANIIAKKSDTWIYNLSVNVQSRASSYLNCLAEISPNLLKDTNNLTAFIVGKSYEPQAANAVSFIFNEPGYTVSSAYYNNINWTYKQAEEFWKDGG